MSVLRRIVFSVNWKLGLAAWSNVYTFPHPIATTPEVVPDNLGEPTLSSRFHRPKDPSQQKGPKLSKSERRKLRKKQAWEKSTGQNAQQQKERKSAEKAGEEEDPVRAGSGADGCGDLNDGTSATKSEDMSDHLSGDVQTRLGQTESDHPADTAESDQSPATKKQKTTERDPSKPAFRVTCNRNGQGHPFDSMGAAANFGGAVYNYFHWNVSMKEFDIEVILNIEERDVTVCLGLTRQSLHHRFIKAFGPTALRATIAYNMLR
jgi:hypothetical protein